MTSWEEGSCDLDFVDSEASNEFTCAVCLSLAVQPRLNPSCGHHYCRPCTEKLVGKGQPCPECRADIINPVPDLYFDRKIKQLKVRCLGSKNGCHWIGQLAELKDHMEYCTLVQVKCDFSFIGCNARVALGDLKTHMQESLAVHVGLLCKQIKKKDDEIAALSKRVETAEKSSQAAEEKTRMVHEKIRKLEKQLASPSTIATPEFVVNNFKERKDKRMPWVSPPFYSHIGGYKMCLRVNPYGSSAGAGTYVSVYVLLMQGENDDHLKWPFRGSITVKLLNHRSLDGDVEVIISCSDSTPNTFAARVVGRQHCSEGWGRSKFIAHSDLSYNSEANTEYLNNDSLTFTVTKVDVA